MTDLQKQIVRTILYFDLFSFPLTAEEIRSFCTIRADAAAVNKALQGLLQAGDIRVSDKHYLPGDDMASVAERKRKLVYSRKLMPKALRNAGLIYAFPFVRAVAISGSLSKYSADEEADIDYFVICAENRLWICRSFLHIFKKTTYLFGRQHDFCMNYFLDESELELKDKNYYTAVEGTTIIPVRGRNGITKFWFDNQWMFSFFPNFDRARLLGVDIEDRSPRIKKLCEIVLGGKIGNWINAGLFSLTVNWWRWKFRQHGFPMEYFDRDLRSTRGESKYHPNDYQRSILQKWADRERDFFRKSSALRNSAPEHPGAPE